MLCQSYFDLDKLKKSFDKCRDNTNYLEKAVKYLESILTEEKFPGWQWYIQVRGTYQNRPYIEFGGHTSGYDNARVGFRYNCCNKKKGSFVVYNINPKIDFYGLHDDYKSQIHAACDPYSQMKIENVELLLSTICPILEGIKDVATINAGCNQLKSFYKELKLSKDF